MKFYDWLMNQVDRDDPIGDLATDAQNDKSAPVRGSVNRWRSYLAHHPTAGWKAREALEEAIVEFGG